MGVAGGLVEAVGEDVGEGVAFGGVAGPAGGSVPAGAVAGGVDVEGDEEDVGGALGCADGVGAADAFFEGDVFGFGDEELGVVAFGLEGCEDLVGEVAGVGVFEEGAVGDSSEIPLEMPGRAGHDVTKVMKSCRERNNRE